MKSDHTSKNGICSHCNAPDNKWLYRYRGKTYCRTCFSILFRLKKCTVCNEKKMIFKDLKTPVCKVCQVKDVPCIRCGKTDYTPGLISEDGPVCNSCAKYFRKSEPKKCVECGTKSIKVGNRKLPSQEVKTLCQNCFNRHLSICTRCSKQKEPFVYDLHTRKPICKKCSTEPYRKCKQCGILIPSGRGRICEECGSKNAIDRKVKYGAGLLSEYSSSLYAEFGKWLIVRRGVKFTSLKLHSYLRYFCDIDEMAESLDRFPSYAEIIEKMSVAKTRKYLLATTFLDDFGAIKVDRETQEEVANKDMIRRYFKRLPDDVWHHKSLEKYYEYMIAKDKTSVRSVRLAVGSAANLLEHSNYLKEDILTQKCLEMYLWKYPGQRSQITGFVNFLKNKIGLAIKIPPKTEPRFSAPKVGKVLLKQRFIDLLRKPEESGYYRDRLIRTAVAYLHNIEIPENVPIFERDLKLEAKKDHCVCIAFNSFLLPTSVFKLYSKAI